MLWGWTDLARENWKFSNPVPQPGKQLLYWSRKRELKVTENVIHIYRLTSIEGESDLARENWKLPKTTRWKAESYPSDLARENWKPTINRYTCSRGSYWSRKRELKVADVGKIAGGVVAWSRKRELKEDVRGHEACSACRALISQERIESWWWLGQHPTPSFFWSRKRELKALSERGALQVVGYLISQERIERFQVFHPLSLL